MFHLSIFHFLILLLSLSTILFVYSETTIRDESTIAGDEEILTRVGQYSSHAEDQRRLSLEFDLVTEESIKTYNGRVPRISCPVGFYRPPGGTDLVTVSGQRQDGCEPCPRGRYGSTTGLTSNTCTKPCPAGKFGPNHGITSEDQCQLCPLGRFGTNTGLIDGASSAKTTQCPSGKCSCVKCPAGKYTSTTGNNKATNCKVCPPGFRGWQCTWAINPRFGEDHDGGHKELFGGDP